VRFRLICFDLDGTLVDSMADIQAALAVALAALPAADRDRDRDAVALGSVGFGLPLSKFLAIARPELDGDAQALEIFTSAYRAQYHAHLLDNTKPFPGVVDTLESLARWRSQGLMLTVTTTKRTDTARRVVEGLGLSKHFDAVLGTDGIPHKPAPDLLYLAARTVERDPEHGLMVGDTVTDLQAGRAAGMATCGVTYGVTGRDGLTPEKPDWLIDALPDMLPIFG
jgi:phosphoglycolate phosphatase